MLAGIQSPGCANFYHFSPRLMILQVDSFCVPCVLVSIKAENLLHRRHVILKFMSLIKIKYCICRATWQSHKKWAWRNWMQAIEIGTALPVATIQTVLVLELTFRVAFLSEINPMMAPHQPRELQCTEALCMKGECFFFPFEWMNELLICWYTSCWQMHVKLRTWFWLFCTMAILCSSLFVKASQRFKYRIPFNCSHWGFHRVSEDKVYLDLHMQIDSLRCVYNRQIRFALNALTRLI